METKMILDLEREVKYAHGFYTTTKLQWFQMKMKERETRREIVHVDLRHINIWNDMSAVSQEWTAGILVWVLTEPLSPKVIQVAVTYFRKGVNNGRATTSVNKA